MSSKKKPRPLFEVPVDIESGRESGWVYRSDEPPRRAPRESRTPTNVEGEREETGGSIVDLGARVLAVGLSVAGQALVLGVKIATMPWTLGWRVFRSCAKQG